MLEMANLLPYRICKANSRLDNRPCFDRTNPTPHCTADSAGFAWFYMCLYGMCLYGMCFICVYVFCSFNPMRTDYKTIIKPYKTVSEIIKPNGILKITLDSCWGLADAPPPTQPRVASSSFPSSVRRICPPSGMSMATAISVRCSEFEHIPMQWLVVLVAENARYIETFALHRNIVFCHASGVVRL